MRTHRAGQSPAMPPGTRQRPWSGKAPFAAVVGGFAAVAATSGIRRVWGSSFAARGAGAVSDWPTQTTQDGRIDWNWFEENEMNRERAPRRGSDRGQAKGKGKGESFGRARHARKAEPVDEEFGMVSDDDVGERAVGRRVDMNAILSAIGGVGLQDDYGTPVTYSSDMDFAKEIQTCTTMNQILGCGIAAFKQRAMSVENIATLFEYVHRALEQQQGTDQAFSLAEDQRFPRLVDESNMVLARKWLDVQDSVLLLRSIAGIHLLLPWLTNVMDLVAAVALAFPDVVDKMDVRDVTICLNSIAILVEADAADDVAPPLLSSLRFLGREVEPAEVPDVVQSIGALKDARVDVIDVAEAVLVVITPEVMKSYDITQLSSLAWGLSRLRFGNWDPALLPMLSDAAIGSFSKMTKETARQHLPKLLCAMRLLDALDNRLLQESADRLLGRNLIKKMQRWELAALAWAWPDLDTMPTFDNVEGQRKGDAKRVYAILVSQAMKKKLSQMAITRAPGGPGNWNF